MDRQADGQIDSQTDEHRGNGETERQKGQLTN
jgi:hypothetical protein